MALSTSGRILLCIAVLGSILEAYTALPIRPTASSPQTQPTVTATLSEEGPAATPLPTVSSCQLLTSRNNTPQQNSTEPEQPSSSTPDRVVVELIKRSAEESSQSANRLQQQLVLDSAPKPVPACFIEPRDPEHQPNSTTEFIERLVRDNQSLLLFIDYAEQVVEESPREGRLYREFQGTMTDLQRNLKQLVDVLDSEAQEDQGESAGQEEPISAHCSDLSLQQQYHILENYLTLMEYIIRDVEGLLTN